MAEAMSWTVKATGHQHPRAAILPQVYVTVCYSQWVIAHEETRDPAVHGLVDNRGAAALLGVDVNTFKVWGTRARSSQNGIPALMPSPVGSFHGNIYKVDDILRLKVALAGYTDQSITPALKQITEKRSLGAYFTPSDAVELMVAWAVRSETETVLEPSLGEGIFLTAVNSYAAKRGWKRPVSVASELDPSTAASAIARGAVEEGNLWKGDFLEHQHDPVDVVIGNPPYVRIRALETAAAAKALAAAEQTIGMPMDPAGSIWMPFVSKSTTHLKRGGRLAFVLPLDLTYVKYARPLWKFLGENFGRLTVLRFRQRVFPEILQNVLILLADEKGGRTTHVSFSALDSVAEYDRLRHDSSVRIPIDDISSGGRPFQSALLSQATREVYDALRVHSEPAKSRAKFNIGYVTGNKKYFHPSARDIAEFNLPPESLFPSAVSTRQLSGGGLRTSSIEATHHLWLPSLPLGKGEKRYVAQGETDTVNQAYKCRIRNPWYVVPGVKHPDVLLTVFSDQPRLYLNDARWVASNSILCGYLHKNEDPGMFVSSWYSPLTLLSSELEVHALGGGVMIAVPREADAIQLLNRTATRTIDEDQLSRALSASEVSNAYGVGNSSLDALVGKDGRQLIWEGIEALGAWRRSESS